MYFVEFNEITSIQTVFNVERAGLEVTRAMCSIEEISDVGATH